MIYFSDKAKKLDNRVSEAGFGFSPEVFGLLTYLFAQCGMFFQRLL